MASAPRDTFKGVGTVSQDWYRSLRGGPSGSLFMHGEKCRFARGPLSGFVCAERLIPGCRGSLLSFVGATAFGRGIRPVCTHSPSALEPGVSGCWSVAGQCRSATHRRLAANLISGIAPALGGALPFVTAPRDTYQGAGTGRKTGAGAVEAIRRGHLRSWGKRAVSPTGPLRAGVNRALSPSAVGLFVRLRYWDDCTRLE